MQFVQNFPSFSILLTLMGAVASSVMSGRRGGTTLLLMAANLAFTVSVMIYTLQRATATPTRWATSRAVGQRNPRRRAGDGVADGVPAGHSLLLFGRHAPLGEGYRADQV